MRDLDDLAASRASRQHGLITRRQALEFGFSADQIQRRRTAHRWVTFDTGVYVIHGAPVTWYTRMMAACLATGGIASHRSCAYLHGVADFRPGRPELTVPRGTRVHTTTARVHQSKDLGLIQPVNRHGIPTTPPNRLAVDLGSVVPFATYELAIDDLVGKAAVSWDDLLDTLLLHARRGRNGVGALRALLLERYGTHVSSSALERSFERMLAQVGLPQPVAQFTIHDDAGFVAIVDFAYPELRIAIELDSKKHHLHATAFEEDRRKRNRLKLAGWLVLEFTWKMVIDQPLAVIRQIEQALDTLQQLRFGS